MKDKIVDGKLYCDQGIIAGCAGGGFENICDAADIMRGAQHRFRQVYHECLSCKYTNLYGTAEKRRGS